MILLGPMTSWNCIIVFDIVPGIYGIYAHDILDHDLGHQRSMILTINYFLKISNDICYMSFHLWFPNHDSWSIPNKYVSDSQSDADFEQSSSVSNFIGDTVLDWVCIELHALNTTPSTSRLLVSLKIANIIILSSWEHKFSFAANFAAVIHAHSTPHTHKFVCSVDTADQTLTCPQGRFIELYSDKTKFSLF